MVEFRANLKTYQRQRAYREAERMWLIRKIGINLEDAPLFDEKLRFMAYEESLKTPANPHFSLR